MILTLHFENRVVRWWSRKHRHFSLTAALMGFSGGSQGVCGDEGAAHSPQTVDGPRTTVKSLFLNISFTKLYLSCPFFPHLKSTGQPKNVTYLQIGINNFITECIHVQYILKTENTKIIFDLSVIKMSALTCNWSPTFFPPFCRLFLLVPLHSELVSRHGMVTTLAGRRDLLAFLLPTSPSLHPKHSWGDHFPPQQHFLNSRRLFLAHLNKGYPRLTQSPQARRHANQRTPQLCCSIHLFIGLLSVCRLSEPLKSTVLPGSTLWKPLKFTTDCKKENCFIKDVFLEICSKHIRLNNLAYLYSLHRTPLK